MVAEILRLGEDEEKLKKHIDDGYQLCQLCGHLLLNGDLCYKYNSGYYYAHPDCFSETYPNAVTGRS